MLLDATESQLVLVDYQERLMPAIFEGPAVLANARRLAEIARMLDVPVWGTEQNPSRLGANDAALRALCQKTLAKMDFSAVGAGLLDCLRPPARPALATCPSRVIGDAISNLRPLPLLLHPPLPLWFTVSVLKPRTPAFRVVGSKHPAPLTRLDVPVK